MGGPGPPDGLVHKKYPHAVILDSRLATSPGSTHRYLVSIRGKLFWVLVERYDNRVTKAELNRYAKVHCRKVR